MDLVAIRQSIWLINGYDAIAEKYTRRIDRLLNLIITSQHPLFIRKIINKEQAVGLRYLLHRIRADRPFLLVALDGGQGIKTDWQLERVRNYYLRQPDPYAWKGDAQAWQEIFHALGLETSDTREY